MSRKSKMSKQTKPQKSYPPEVREKAVKLITELGYSVADDARQLGRQTPNEMEAKYHDESTMMLSSH